MNRPAFLKSSVLTVGSAALVLINPSSETGTNPVIPSPATGTSGEESTDTDTRVVSGTDGGASERRPAVLRIHGHGPYGHHPVVGRTDFEDPGIVDEWDDVFRQRLERAYRALSVSTRLHFDEFAGGHRWSGRAAYPLLDSTLGQVLGPTKNRLGKGAGR